jgi:hypothetical protein
MSRSIALVVALLGLGTALPAGNAVGINPNGIVMFDANGHISFQAVPALISSNDRRKVTRPEAERSFEVAQRRCPNGRC